MGGHAPFDGPVSLTVNAWFLRPKSTTKKRREARTWKSTRPDADNICKIIMDAMNGVVYRDDSQVCDLRVTKRFHGTSGIRIYVERLAE